MYNFTADHNESSFHNNFSQNLFRANVSGHAAPYWNLRTAYGAISKLVALIINTFLVYLFIRHRSVRTSFNVYVVNLCISNMIYLWIYYPVSLLNEWTLYILKPKAVCVFLRYMIYTFGGLIVNSHFLIALNRFWAVAFPISYRTYHKANSLARPALVCLIMWILVHIVNFPSVVIDSLQPQSSAEYIQCMQNVRGPRWWLLTVTFLAYNIPLVSSVMIYPFILYKTLFGTRVRRVNTLAHPPTVPTGNTGNQAGNQHPHVTVANSAAVSRVVDEPVEDTCWGRLQGRGGGQFLTLSLLTVNVTIALLPMQIYFTLLMFGIYPPSMFSIIAIPYSLSWIIDPTLFLLTLKTLRDAVKLSFKLKH